MSLSWQVVKVKKGLWYNCIWLCYNPGRWKCGKCLKGNLGFKPKFGDKCKVCKASVSYVSMV